MATVSLNSTHPLNSFSRGLKSSLSLGLRLLDPLLASVISNHVEYPLANSQLQIYHQYLSIIYRILAVNIFCTDCPCIACELQGNFPVSHGHKLRVCTPS